MILSKMHKIYYSATATLLLLKYISRTKYVDKWGSKVRFVDKYGQNRFQNDLYDFEKALSSQTNNKWPLYKR